jgi:hypothetical protein
MFCGRDVRWTVNDVLSVQVQCVNSRDMPLAKADFATQLHLMTHGLL